MRSSCSWAWMEKRNPFPMLDLIMELSIMLAAHGAGYKACRAGAHRKQIHEHRHKALRWKRFPNYPVLLVCSHVLALAMSSLILRKRSREKHTESVMSQDFDVMWTTQSVQGWGCDAAFLRWIFQ